MILFIGYRFVERVICWLLDWFLILFDWLCFGGFSGVRVLAAWLGLLFVGYYWVDRGWWGADIGIEFWIDCFNSVGYVYCVLDFDFPWGCLAFWLVFYLGLLWFYYFGYLGLDCGVLILFVGFWNGLLVLAVGFNSVVYVFVRYRWFCYFELFIVWLDCLCLVYL